MARRIYRTDSELNVLAATIYAEARGEPDEGQVWVAWVIKNRARAGRSYWGYSIQQVCLQPWQFECWNGVDSIVIYEEYAFNKALQIAQSVINSPVDPTGGCDHYNNPDKENADWVRNVDQIRRINNHVFYRSR